MLTPEELVQVVNSPSSKASEIRKATNALVKQYDLIALNALNYDTRKGDIKRENVVAAVREYLPGIMERFDPKTAKFSTFVDNNIRPKAPEIYESSKDVTSQEMARLDSPQAQEIVAEVSAVETIESEIPRSKINVLSLEKVSNKKAKLNNLVKVEDGVRFKEITDKHAGEVAEEIFDVPVKKITDPNKNLTYAKKIVDGIPESSEAGNIQNFYRIGNNMENTIKILPEFNVTKKDADINELGENIDVSPTVKGRSLGLKNKILQYFYDPVIEDGKPLPPFPAAPVELLPLPPSWPAPPPPPPP